MEEASRFQNVYDNVTTLGAESLGLLVVGVIAIFVLPRRYVLLPIILVSSFVPASQRVVIAGLDFPFLRLMTIIAWACLLSRREIRGLQWNRIDSLFTAWILCRVLVTTLRTATFGALTNQLGQTLDAFGIYFLVRVLVRDWKDLDRVVLSFVLVSIPVSISMLYEFATGWNPASVFGYHIGIAVARDDRIRATCGYAHPILAGCFWASLVPIIAARLWQHRTSRALTAAGLIAAILCVITSSSSTPLIGLGVIAIGGATWVARYRMNVVRWGIVGVLVVLEIVMEKPLWHIFHRTGALGLSSSTGYHRYRLFDNFVKHFADWAPLGLNSTAYWGRQMDDVTNVFIGQAVHGGLLGLVLIIALFVVMYQRNGRLVRSYRGRRDLQIYAWGLGVALFAHTAMMNATAYYSQILLPWYTCFALIASMKPLRRRAHSKASRALQPGEEPGRSQATFGRSAQRGISEAGPRAPVLESPARRQRRRS